MAAGVRDRGGLIALGALLSWLAVRARAPALVPAGGYAAVVALADLLDPVPARAAGQLAAAGLAGLVYWTVIGSPTARAALDPGLRELLRLPRIAGLSPEVTAVADHYVVDIDLQDPIVDAASWRLDVGGLVERRLSLGFEELQDRFALLEEHAALS